MQYRLFMHCTLIALVCACYALGLLVTLISLIVFSLLIECISWLKILEPTCTTSDIL